MKKPFYTLYDKVKVYSGAPVNKGFYDRNLSRANKLYIKDNWKPPKPKPIKKVTKNTFAQKVNNYMNDYKILKQKFNFPEEEKQVKYVDKSYDEIDEEKIFIMNNIIDEGEVLSEQNLFKNTDEIIDSMKDDKNYNYNKDLSLLKTTQNINDYNLRLFQKGNETETENENENENELISQTDEDKNISINNLNNEAKIDENNDEQIEENNVEEIIENKENKDNKENKENKEDNKNDENIILKSEEKITNENENNNELLKDKIINKNINENEDIEYPLFESVIKSDYNKEYNIYDYYNEEFKKKLDEIQEIDEKEKKIENNNNNIFTEDKEEYDYENEFKNEDENSYNEPKVFDDDINESNNNDKLEEVEDFIKDNI